MKRFDYFKYEEKINTDQLRKLSGTKTLKICFDLIDTGFDFLRASIALDKPHLSPAALQKEANNVLWSKEDKLRRQKLCRKTIHLT